MTFDWIAILAVLKTTKTATLCSVEDESPIVRPFSFDCGRPEDHRDPLPEDVRFLLDCGIRPDDVRDDLKVLDR